MKKILVTGGAGMIGLEVSTQLKQLGYEVHLFDLGEQIKRANSYIDPKVRTYYGSILDLSSLRSAMKNCDVVFHLGAMLGVKRTEQDKLRCIEINIEGTKNVLECAVQQRVRKIVFASSSEVYGEPLNNPITERFITQGKTVYAITKLAGEELCKAFSEQYPIDVTILRYFNCYGPFQTAQFVISNFIFKVQRNLPPIINGDGNQIRSYTYVSDTARATILSAFNERANGQILNIGYGGSPISLKDLADLVIDISGKKEIIKPEYRKEFQNTDRMYNREIFERFCNSEKAQKLLDWKPKIKIELGIKKIIEKGIIFERWEHLYDEQN